MLDANDINHLKSLLGDESVSTGESVRKLHSHDESYHAAALPDVVLWPHNTEDVSKVVKWAYESKVPITAWGAGTSLEGNPIPVKGGLVIDFQEMNKIIDIRQEDFQVDV